MALSFAPHLEAVPLEEAGLVLVGELGCDVYPGAVFAKLAELVDGRRDEADVIAAVGEDRDAAAAAIARLRQAGALIDANGSVGTDTAAWWSSQLVSPDDALARVGTASVEVVPLGDVDPEPTVAALAAAGVELRTGGERLIVLVEDYLDEGLQDVNARALAEDRSWLLAAPQAAMLLVGPAFIPEHGPCWECLAAPLRRKREVQRQVRAIAAGGAPRADAAANGRAPRISTPFAHHSLGPAIVATEALRWLGGVEKELESTVLSFDTRGWDSQKHRVIWRPQCPACGVSDAPLERPAMPIRLRKGGGGEPRTARPRPGELRTVAPRVTLERYEHHVSPLTGAVHGLFRMPSPLDLHVYAATDRAVRINGDRKGWEFLSGMASSGKGTTDESARASALCEALERHSSEFFGDEPRREATLDELGESALAPNDCMGFSDQQFEQREQWNERAESYRTFVPERFDRSERIAWSPAWSLTHERERLLPTAFCYFGAHVPGARFCVGESNGNAAGNTLEEAILHGLLELVERDHVALWWYNRTPLPGVDLDTIDDPWLGQLREHIARQGRELWAVDLTADLGIAAAVCLVASSDGAGLGMGFGAHPDLAGAVVRAATELAQLGLGGSSGGMGSGPDPTLHLNDHPFARPDPASSLRSCAGHDRFSGSVIDALAHCQQAFEMRAMEVLVLDQTRADIGLPVVKTIVPGMRHFWPRFGPGRLYDVPVELGRLPRPRTEDELNPIPPTS